MKITSVLYQLFLERVNSYSAIALSLCLALASAPAMAQDNTIELQDAGSSETPTEEQDINYKDLPPLENNNSNNPSSQDTPSFASRKHRVCYWRK